ncbi:hypothetical protein BLA29_013634 [Euroglyphus maynei]|uniref:Uncharacterized protein n=1 Tax=Euroglyphus maynei TaxID=6958 RepID=A0A1Y3AQ69_EURMA|nr:hypothetical protein BLA29_013634 [Euroglyphus maynei]
MATSPEKQQSVTTRQRLQQQLKNEIITNESDETTETATPLTSLQSSSVNTRIHDIAKGLLKNNF